MNVDLSSLQFSCVNRLLLPVVPLSLKQYKIVKSVWFCFNVVSLCKYFKNRRNINTSSTLDALMLFFVYSLSAKIFNWLMAFHLNVVVAVLFRTIFKDIRFPSYYLFEIMFLTKWINFLKWKRFGWFLYIECTFDICYSNCAFRFYSPSFWLINAVNFVVVFFLFQHWAICIFIPFYT